MYQPAQPQQKSRNFVNKPQKTITTSAQTNETNRCADKTEGSILFLTFLLVVNNNVVKYDLNPSRPQQVID